jgi:hypothetical protein
MADRQSSDSRYLTPRSHQHQHTDRLSEASATSAATLEVAEDRSSHRESHDVRGSGDDASRYFSPTGSHAKQSRNHSNAGRVKGMMSRITTKVGRSCSEQQQQQQQRQSMYSCGGWLSENSSSTLGPPVEILIIFSWTAGQIVATDTVAARGTTGSEGEIWQPGIMSNACTYLHRLEGGCGANGSSSSSSSSELVMGEHLRATRCAASRWHDAGALSVPLSLSLSLSQCLLVTSRHSVQAREKDR